MLNMGTQGYPQGKKPASLNREGPADNGESAIKFEENGIQFYRNLHMSKNIPMDPLVEDYFRKAKNWKEELSALRTVLLDTPLTEEWKWRAPCYTFQGGNVVILHQFKENCALGFFKGALLKDDKGILIKPGENTQAGRMIRFANLQEIKKLSPILKTYVKDAIEVEKNGIKAEFKGNKELLLPGELQTEMDGNPVLKASFQALTPGRQRAYAMHFTAAKLASTRVSRIQKCIPRILAGKGLNDCICGLSQKMPQCDGSHKCLE